MTVSMHESNSLMQKSTALSKLIVLKKIVEETSHVTGKKFFELLVKNLAETLDLHGVWVTEYDRENYQLNSLAFWLKNKLFL